MLRLQIQEKKQENREIVHVIFYAIRHLEKQKTPFKDHNESNESENRGNFLEQLSFLANYQEPIKKYGWSCTLRMCHNSHPLLRMQ